MTDDEKYINDEIKNKYDNSPYRIPLRNRNGVVVEFALVDEKDFENVNSYKWHLMKVGYACCSNIDKKRMYMHHFVHGRPGERRVIDHMNEDKLDNRRSNLRESTRAENNRNISKKKKDATSTYKGVHYNKQMNKYIAQYCGKGTLYYGDNEVDAATIYDIYTFREFGKDANNNKIISYEDALKHEHNFDKVKTERELPANISMVVNVDGEYYFRVKKYVDNKRVTYTYNTLEKAVEKLEKINFLIKLSEIIKKKAHKLKEIRRNEEGIAIIIAYSGEHILVSDEDWHMLSNYKWYMRTSVSSVYPVSNYNKRMHNLLIPNDNFDLIVHHRNSNTLDNRRENLVLASRSENMHQRKKSANCASKYHGVWFHKTGNKWSADIWKEGKKYYLGLFETEVDAARAYNEKAKILFGEFANLNLIP